MRSNPFSGINWKVVCALLPAGLAGVYLFGRGALWTILIAVCAAVAAEWLLLGITRTKGSVTDGSALLTGLLLAYNLPSHVPFWLPAAGALFAIVVAKHAFGGSGKNIFNPALAGRVFLLVTWPRYMTAFTLPGGRWPWEQADTVASATPLALLKGGMVFGRISYLDLLLGRRAGCIGEVCIAALLAGALFLLARRYISWHIPVTFIAAVAVITYVFSPQGFFRGEWLLHLCTGGLVLGAFFMATDIVTSPCTKAGKLFFGAGCGALTAGIRLWGGYPEGVSFAILIMNAAVPFIDRVTLHVS